MHNVFLLYMPPGNAQAMVHYEDTIKQRVDLQRLSRFISQDLRARLVSVFGANRIAVWGSEAGPRNRNNFDRMSVGDDILIVEGNKVRLIGKIAAKTESATLSRELWKSLSGTDDTTWQLIYFIANPRELNLPFSAFCGLFGYAQSFRLRGFASIAGDRLETFYRKYDDLYSILVRLENGEAVQQRIPEAVSPDATQAEPVVELKPELVDEVLRAELISDHVRMQWKLAKLGLMAGERVWVPVGDQAKLRQTFKFNDFDPEFAAGIDLPHSYIENIDVVWKREFRIGAAYEIENSTSIYSGLLRFADLNILAPNTLYPMFVVAPADRKNRLRQQLSRPTFKKLELDRKVRFLSYESIDAIDTFFSGPSDPSGPRDPRDPTSPRRTHTGLSIDLIFGRSEQVT